VTLNATELKIRKEILGVGWPTKHARRWIQAGSFLVPRAAGKWNLNHLTSAIYFNCRGKVKSFGNDLAREDAARIEKMIQAFLHVPGKAA
jgi:hypothetical protein